MSRQVFIDYNISGMSYVHMQNALFLRPLPDLSSVPASQLPGTSGQQTAGASAPSTGVFLCSTVPADLVAHPPNASCSARSQPPTSTAGPVDSGDSPASTPEADSANQTAQAACPSDELDEVPTAQYALPYAT